MEFRPCIDIHNGKVKQIVGSSLRDQGDTAKENFVADCDASFYAEFYKKDGIRGGHIILLNARDSSYYNDTKAQAFLALKTYPGGLQAGGGITDENAAEFLDAGASPADWVAEPVPETEILPPYTVEQTEAETLNPPHWNGKIDYGNLRRLASETGKDHLVLDLSCRKRDDDYYIVTDRWQKFTEEKVTPALLDELASYADEFLVHAVDVEGKADGIEEPLAEMLGSWGKIPLTYAGGVRDFSDIEKLKELGKNRLNVTIGSALDLFGGKLSYREVVDYMKADKGV